MKNRRSFLAALLVVPICLPLLKESATSVIATKTSFFGEQPGDEEGSIVLQDIHADGSYSVRQQLFYGEHV